MGLYPITLDFDCIDSFGTVFDHGQSDGQRAIEQSAEDMKEDVVMASGVLATDNGDSANSNGSLKRKRQESPERDETMDQHMNRNKRHKANGHQVLATDNVDLDGKNSVNAIHA